ncbi:hypothetical protein ACFV4N_20895 [Actinosynnema sp. NPDC059797]
MTSILIALAVVALVVYGLERNHRGQPSLGSRLAGSNDVEDRDVPRVRGELHAARPHAAEARPERHGAPRLEARPVQPTGC